MNNAAYQMAQPGGIADITTEQFDRVMKTNLYAMFWLCKKALPHLQPRLDHHQHLLGAGRQPVPQLLDYATTKAGILNFTEALAAELAEKGHPGQRGRARADLDAADPGHHARRAGSEHGESAPLGRAGQPAEVAPAYVFFASQESSYITGEMLGVTGGNPVS